MAQKLTKNEIRAEVIQLQRLTENLCTMMVDNGKLELTDKTGQTLIALRDRLSELKKKI